MKISVIVVAYNVQNYIIKCLKSLYNQEMQDVEFLIVDDGSTDLTGLYINEFIDYTQDTRFKYLFKENGGQSDARNFGLKKAKGKYIWYIDGDDYIPKEKSLLKNLVDKALINRLDVLIFNYRYDSHWNLKYANKLALTLKSDSKIKNGIEILDSKEFNFSIWHMLFKREMLIQNGITFKKESTAEDLLYTVQTLLNVKRVMYDEKCGYVYVYRSNSITKSNNPEKIKKRIDDVINTTLLIDKQIKENNLLKINLSNLLVSGYIAQALMACATGYVNISRHQMKNFLRGKKLTLKQRIKKIILIYLPTKLRKKVCKKILRI